MTVKTGFKEVLGDAGLGGDRFDLGFGWFDVDDGCGRGRRRSTDDFKRCRRTLRVSARRSA